MKIPHLIMITQLILISFLHLHAQEGLTVSGSVASGTGGSSSYSIGQIVYTTDTGSKGTVAKGLQQAYEITVITDTHIPYTDLELTVYPNPSIHYLNLKVQPHTRANFRYQLFDQQGKVIASQKVQEDITTISMQNLPKAVYFIYVHDDNQILETFKILKQ